MKKLLIVLIICSFCFLLQDNTIFGDKIVEDCVCAIMVECYYPGYKSGIDPPFASKIVYSCDEANKYMKYMSSQEIKYPDNWIEIPKYCPPVFFYLHPAYAF